MLHRRQFLRRTLQGSSLVALSGLVPEFLARTAAAAAPGKDRILVVLELNGGNDGLNTVVPYADEHYAAARPTLKLSRQELIRIDDTIGLHPGLRGFDRLLNNGQLAIVQGVGYPNPDRSHFESMDIWQSADPKRQMGTGWLGRSLGELRLSDGAIPAMHIGTEKLPLAVQGSAFVTPTIHPSRPLELQLEDGSASGPETGLPRQRTAPVDPRRAERLKLLQELSQPGRGLEEDLLQFVRRSALQTYTAIERLRELLQEERNRSGYAGTAEDRLAEQLGLVARLIRAGFGTRIFYVYLSGFDTHSAQRAPHAQLLTQVSQAVGNFFTQLEQSKDAERVVLMTFSEFGRRVQENGSGGTDHGAASCLFVAGPAVRGGPVGKHPSLAREDLVEGDVKHHTDFRQVYATLLDGWLNCDSRRILGDRFEPLPFLRTEA